MSTFFTVAAATDSSNPERRNVRPALARIAGMGVTLILAGAMLVLSQGHNPSALKTNENWSAAAVLQTEQTGFTQATWNRTDSTPAQDDASWNAEHSRPLYYLVSGADRKAELEAMLIWEEQESPGLSMVPRVRVVIDAEHADTATLESIPFNARVIDTRP